MAPTAATGLTIPKGTPFTLSATATDPNGDALTYSWEEMDKEASGSALAAADDGAMPLFRDFNPTISGNRTDRKSVV